ncbi:MAG: lipoyl synthase [bacterium]
MEKTNEPCARDKDYCPDKRIETRNKENETAIDINATPGEYNCRHDNYPPPRDKPEWLKISISGSGESARVRETLDEERLATVCEEAGCPNRSECWNEGTATFMILGKTCTRGCAFCDVNAGPEGTHRPDEPLGVARSVDRMELDYVVITSVTRDDLDDGGARQWQKTINAVREHNPQVKVEVLVPDFGGVISALEKVFKASPEVFGHNIETVPRLYSRVRPGALYERSRRVLELAGQAGLVTKSGMMLGMGETPQEVKEVLRDLYDTGVKYLTLGQYLRPSRRHWPVDRWVSPAEFSKLADFARELGYKHVEAGPFVRSSYHAAHHLSES